MTNPLELILLIDDDDTTNHVNKRLLTRMNVAREIKVMNNGQEAFNYLKECQEPSVSEDNHYPDLILLDLKMPVMDGFSFLEAFQSAELEKEDQVIILMLTSSASFYDLEKLKQFKQVKKHYSKALTETDVKEILQNYFSEN